MDGVIGKVTLGRRDHGPADPAQERATARSHLSGSGSFASFCGPRDKADFRVGSPGIGGALLELVPDRRGERLPRQDRPG